MQSYRTLSKRLPATITKRVFSPTTTRTMAYFPRSLVASDTPSSFTPLFRLLDDFDTYSNSGRQHTHKSHVRSFQPKFDLKELPETYELHGELPGVDQKDVEIEFTEPQTITIRGRVERQYTSGTPPSGAIESGKGSATITESGEHARPPKPSVEDEDTAANDSTVTVSQDKKAEGSETPEADVKYWVSERSIGEFARSFNFPTRVDQDQVKASIKDGILTVIVPKAKKHESRKITIS